MQDNNQPQRDNLANSRQPIPAPAYRDEIDLFELWSILWQSKWIIAGVTAVFTIAAIVTSLMLPDFYRSEVLLAPANAEEQAMLTSMDGQLGGLASLAGIDLSGRTTSKTTLALEVLKSRAFLTEFINKHDLAVPLMASSGWDSRAHRWVIDDDIYDVQTNTWVRNVAPPRAPEPSNQEMYEYFKDNILTINEDKKTGLIRVSIELTSPAAAQEWLSLLIKDLNDYMRSVDVGEAEKSISYLQDQIKDIAITKMQDIFYQLIERQTKTIMLAKVRNEYVFKVIDPAIVPEQKSRPNRVLICAAASLAGMFSGLIYVLLVGAYRKPIKP